MREIFHCVQQASAFDHANPDDIHLRIEEVRAVYGCAHPYLLEILRSLSSPSEILCKRSKESTLASRSRDHIRFAWILMFEFARLRYDAFRVDPRRSRQSAVPCQGSHAMVSPELIRLLQQCPLCR
jgi:hypothetical protein